MAPVTRSAVKYLPVAASNPTLCLGLAWLAILGWALADWRAGWVVARHLHPQHSNWH